MKLMAKRLLVALILLLPLLFSAGPAAAQSEAPYFPYDLYIFPSIISPNWFHASPLVNEVYRPEAVTVPGTAIDQNGIMYYVVSERDAVLAATQIFEWNDLLQTYDFTIVGITAEGQRFNFAWGRLPLKSYIAGITFNTLPGYEGAIDGRMLLYIRTLELDETACPFLVPLNAPMALPKAIGTPQTSSTGPWDLSAMESCFREGLSLLQITGYFERLPEFAPQFAF